MLRLFIVVAIICLILIFIQQLKAYMARDKKLQELKDAKLKGELMDIDKKIAEETSRQQDISEEIEDIKSEHTTKTTEPTKESTKETIND